MHLQDIFCLNCRGVKSREFLGEMKEFNKLHKPVIIILMEPHISGEMADSAYKKLGKTNGFDWIQRVLVGEFGVYGTMRRLHWI